MQQQREYLWDPKVLRQLRREMRLGAPIGEETKKWKGLSSQLDSIRKAKRG